MYWGIDAFLMTALNYFGTVLIEFLAWLDRIRKRVSVDVIHKTTRVLPKHKKPRKQKKTRIS
jgi:hypothetical protein